MATLSSGRTLHKGIKMQILSAMWPKNDIHTKKKLIIENNELRADCVINTPTQLLPH